MKKLVTLLTLAVIAGAAASLAACETANHTHTYSDEWTSDATQHWHAATCEHTDEKADVAAHTPGAETYNEATGNYEVRCTECGYLMSTHAHAYSAEWSSDQDGHWHAATCAHNVTSGYAAHTAGEAVYDPETDSYVTTCTVCGYTLSSVAEDGSSEYPFVIDGVSEWQEKLVNGGNATAGKYWTVASDLDFSSVTTQADVTRFSGTIDFKNHTVSGLNLTNCANLFSGCYGGLFYQTSDATIENLTYTLSDLGTDNAVRVVLYVYGDTTLKNVTANGAVSYSDNNVSSFVYTVMSSDTTLSFIRCTNYASISNSGGNSGVFLGKVYENDASLSEVTLVFDGCVNFGTVYSSAGNVSMLISNACSFKYLDVNDVTVSDCVNYGRLYAGTGKNAYLFVGTKWTGGQGITLDRIAAFETAGVLENGEGGVCTQFDNYKTLEISDGKYSLPATEGAAYYVLTFSFWATKYDDNGTLVQWGTANVSVTFDSLEIVDTFPAYAFVNESEATDDVTPMTLNGTTLYTTTADGTKYFVFKDVQGFEGYGFKTQPSVTFTAYDADGNVLSVAK